MLEAEPGLRTAEAMAFRGAGRFPPSMPRFEAVKNAGTVNGGAFHSEWLPGPFSRPESSSMAGEQKGVNLKGIENELL